VDWNLYAFLADVVVTVHFAYIVFTVGGLLCILVGGAFGWRWVRNVWFRTAHAIAVCIVAVQAIVGVLCPLTTLEYSLRRRAGRVIEDEISFVARLIRTVIFYDFSPEFFLALYVGFALLVLATIVFVPPRIRR
jgi:hypothetical protein